MVVNNLKLGQVVEQRKEANIFYVYTFDVYSGLKKCERCISIPLLFSSFLNIDNDIIFE